MMKKIGKFCALSVLSYSSVLGYSSLAYSSNDMMKLTGNDELNDKNLTTFSEISQKCNVKGTRKISKPEQKYYEDKNYIINGDPADYLQYPSVVAITEPTGKNEYCSGILIKPDFVLTAAHCIPFADLVIYHVSDINQDYDPSNKHEVALAIAHPNYNPNMTYEQNDVGWILLRDSIEDADTVTILPKSVFSTALNLAEMVEIAGYGLDNHGLSGKLYSAEVPINFFFTKEGLVCFSDMDISEMVVGLDEANAPNLCYGDSGGPTYIIRDGKVYVTGVTSRVPPGKPTQCGHGAVVSLPGYYEKITDEFYRLMKSCRDEGVGCEGIGQSDGGDDDVGKGGNDGHGGDGGSGAVFPDPSEESFITLSGSGCDCYVSKRRNNKDEDNKEGTLTFFLAAMVLGLRRRKLV